VRRAYDLPLSARNKEKEIYQEERGKEPSKEDMTGRTASFTGLSYAACGADLIGCLRMDVDNLGKIFSKYLNEFDLVSLSHLSKMLNIFGLVQFKVTIWCSQCHSL
jgi:CRISPR-associated protein Csm1